MGNIFGKKSSKPSKQPAITEQDRAILQLKQQRDRLNQNRRRVESQLDREREVAKQLLKNGQKDRALLLLRKKKMLETQLTKSENILENVERMTHDLEFAQVQVDVVNSLRQGTDALKKMNDILKLEDIEQLMEDSREAIEYQNEVSNLLSGGLSRADEQDVEAELDELIRADEANQLGQLPDVPHHRQGERTRVSPTKSKQRVLAEAD
ncbi:unnamed protein product [Adineta steineri]|uniref:Charged multivesicular body protein 6 n=1 Tax=Adineta steineri TaxID=433720 RepID=A0A819EEL0_9BILA|nr:unnamed protein product [Adineta steineri]CAF3848439.1 unnamed protein product [Adineta steineri]